MSVTLNALQQALHLVDDLADVDDSECVAVVALPGLARLVGCDYLSYTELGPAPGQMRVAGYPHQEPPAGLDAFAAHVHEHPLVNHYRESRDGRPVKISDFLSRGEFHRLGLYNEFFRLFPVEHQIAVSLAGAEKQIIGIAFNRAGSDFTERDRDLLEVLREPLEAAMCRCRRRESARRVLRTASSGGCTELTQREAQILELVGAGRTNAAIARALELSPRTVAKHLEHIYRKLDVTCRAAAVGHAASVPAQRSRKTEWLNGPS